MTRLIATIGIVCLLGMAACGGEDEQQRATTATSTTTSTVEQRPVKKVSANDASEAEIVKALEAAGVSNAERWAGEIEEYRPYAKGDRELTKLRGELEKYNPGPGVIDRIVSVLEP